MQNESYTTSWQTGQDRNLVYTAINNVPAWWTGNFEGSAQKLNDEFTLTFGETYIKLKVAELVTNYRVVWQVTDSFKHFLNNKNEWNGTRLVFDIKNQENEGTRITFTHEGLVSPLECYPICTDAWSGYLHGSLKNLIETGKGKPDAKVQSEVREA